MKNLAGWKKWYTIKIHLEKTLDLLLNTILWPFFKMHIWGWYAIQVSQFFLQHWNRWLFSQLNTWWSSWLAFRGHVVQKIVSLNTWISFSVERCSYYESNSGAEMAGGTSEPPRFPVLCWGICSSGKRDRITHTIYILPFLSFSFWQSKYKNSILYKSRKNSIWNTTYSK